MGIFVSGKSTSVIATFFSNNFFKHVKSIDLSDIQEKNNFSTKG
jgi:hypothetical protein